jgi:hypothetical protein
MGNAPYDFVMSHSDTDLQRLDTFVHRTFNGIDFAVLLEFKNIYENHHGLESVFAQNKESATMQKSITEFKRYF